MLKKLNKLVVWGNRNKYSLSTLAVAIFLVYVSIRIIQGLLI